MNSKPLVLVTRADPGGAELAARVRLLGLPVVPVELYRLEAMKNSEKVARQVAEALPVDLLVLTSQEGVRQARDLPIGDQLISLPTVVPGQGTAEVARAAGFSRVIAPDCDGTSEAMLALKALTEVAGKRVLILAASQGRRLLDQELKQRGAHFQRLNVYRRTPLPIRSDIIGQIQSAERLIALIASSGALQSLHQQLDPSLWRKLANGKVLVPSARIADNARRWGCHDVTVTKGADNQAMLDALELATSSR